MIKKIFVSCLLFVLSFGVNAQTGLEVMEEQQKRHDVALEFSDTTMTLYDSRGKARPRRMISYSKKPKDKRNKTLIKFVKPTNIRNVGLLTWEQQESEEDDQWLYLPASKKIKRITGGSKANPFMGSDFAFEDMRPENLDSHSYEIKGEENVDGHNCWIVEALPSTPKEAKDSGYSKRTMWVRKDIYITVKTEFYDRRNKLSKIGTYAGLEDIGSGVWRSNEITMEKQKRKTKTIIVTDNRDLEADISDSLFDTQSLKRPPLVK
jgi:hypothetical protein